MTIREKTEQIRAWEKKLSAYRMALTMISLDANANPPVQGAAYRNERRALLAGEYLKLQNDEEIYRLLEELDGEMELSGDEARMVELYLRQFRRVRSLPHDEYVEFQKILSESEQEWLRAKKEKDYPSYAPYLKAVISGYAHLTSLQDSPLSLYDRMLDQNQSGWNEAKYDAFFTGCRERLVPLIRRISEAEPIDTSFLHLHYPAEIQRLAMREILDYVGFTEDWGKLSESEHPLTTGVCRGDVRFTTKYRENNIALAVLSSVHESGHAWFAHQIDPAYEGTIIGSSIDAGLHESQSRFCENHLARSLPFWEVCFPILQKYFPEQLSSVTTVQFWRALNAVQPSLIRTDADELTYPLHIMIRYEIEKGLFSGTVSADDLSTVWNEKYKEYLGVDVPDDAAGILQDMHWPYAYFGYFPTYALGSAFAAQFAYAAGKDLGMDSLLRNREYGKIMAWLKEHVHKYAGRYAPDEIVRMATGEEFTPEYYLGYLEKKYTDLYGL
ncbi:MAG: carboxypeptidase M32 [Solobacterium sp.]|nr:carboxypeptidase M32 [Solobacterium sp.]